MKEDYSKQCLAYNKEKDANFRENMPDIKTYNDLATQYKQADRSNRRGLVSMAIEKNNENSFRGLEEKRKYLRAMPIWRTKDQNLQFIRFFHRHITAIDLIQGILEYRGPTPNHKTIYFDPLPFPLNLLEPLAPPPQIIFSKSFSNGDEKKEQKKENKGP